MDDAFPFPIILERVSSENANICGEYLYQMSDAVRLKPHVVVHKEQIGALGFLGATVISGRQAVILAQTDEPAAIPLYNCLAAVNTAVVYDEDFKVGVILCCE